MSQNPSQADIWSAQQDGKDLDGLYRRERDLEGAAEWPLIRNTDDAITPDSRTRGMGETEE